MKKTKMKIMSLLLSMVLFLFVPFLNLQAAADHPARLVDQAELLTAEEQQQIQAKLDEVSELHHCDAVVMTVNSLEGKTATEYADDAFDYDGYGLGEDKAGILFLVDMGDRNWATSTHGYAITAFTDAGLSYIEEKLVSYLGDGEYAEAFNCFAEQCDRFLTQAETGEPYDVDNMPQEPFACAFWLVVCLAFGFVIALITASIKRSKLTSVVKRTTAEEYMKKGSLNLTVKQDRFINKVVTSRPVPKNDNDSHSGGGGSSTHVSSSGEVHGGHSGKF